MKTFTRTVLLIMAAAFLSGTIYAQPFVRIGTLPLPATENAGFGNMVAGVDFDGDGKQEIYAVNNNWGDSGEELIPKIFKYEFNGVDNWTLVWKATLNIPLQNTWPALTHGDWDNDGKMEIIWGPVNFTGASNPNPPRIVVFEEKGDGSDIMGVPDPGNPGNYLPNAKWNLGTGDNENLRPIRWHLTDIDADTKKELVFSTRAGSYAFGVVGVSTIPDNGDGSEMWTLEYSGGTGTTYDLAVVGSNAYLMMSNGDVVPVTYSSGAYTVHPAVTGATGGGSWWSASTVDINGDNTKEIVVASWSATAGQGDVFLLQVNGASVTSTQIADLTSLIGTGGRIYGGTAGDIDRDGKMDFVFGTRDATPNAAIARVEYQSGPINNPASYTSSLIDQEYTSAGGRWMHLAIANVDGDALHEVLYGEGTGDTQPIVIIDATGQVVPVELTSFSASSVHGQIQLSWQTASELNNHGFEIQRKSGDNNFATVAFVEGKGTTTETNNYSFVDNSVEQGSYTYRLKQIDFNGHYSYSQEIEVDMAPSSFTLEQNYPNPFNPATVIRFAIPMDMQVELRVYSMLGEEVAMLVNEFKSAGTHDVKFNAADLPSGTYVYSLKAGSQIITKKMMLVK